MTCCMPLISLLVVLRASLWWRKGITKTQWGWSGTRTWKKLADKIKKEGTIGNLSGKMPTRNEAIDLIKESGGRIQRIEGAHSSPNSHNYPHINYKLYN